MASNYPASKQTFTNPIGTQTLDVPDHALMHGTVNDTLGSIQDTIGTTLGTNVLKSFATGEFPIRATGVAAIGTLKQTIVGGTLQNNLIGTSQITGGSVTSATFVTPTLNNAILGTPAITGGSLTSSVLVSPTSPSGSAIKGALQTMITNNTLVNGSAPGTTPVVMVAGTFTTTQTANVYAVVSGAWYNSAAVQNHGTLFLNGVAITGATTIVDDFAAPTQGRVFSAAGISSGFSGIGTVSMQYSVGGAGTAIMYGAQINIQVFNA